MNKPECNSCKFFSRYTLLDRQGRCRRYPSAISSPVAVQDTDWCGEYINKDEDEKSHNDLPRL